eukprot:CAMPEP_0172174334 /NCGR_PEP_ID=MMETSP1050-20130122/13599_1 /TAXON_ID=233186 /ORGANISM="Cryptomonas curvata, Strain CCAP979/52" /LENGTH=179 /DNA_ID=CAMNT_0012846283 /DNA_START=234 /DNA_END=773 /DNA_ORIENTATION=+
MTESEVKTAKRMDSFGHHSTKLDDTDGVDMGGAGDENSTLLSNITESEADTGGVALNPDGLSEDANSTDSAVLSAANGTESVVETQGGAGAAAPGIFRSDLTKWLDEQPDLDVSQWLNSNANFDTSKWLDAQGNFDTASWLRAQPDLDVSKWLNESSNDSSEWIRRQPTFDLGEWLKAH